MRRYAAVPALLNGDHLSVCPEFERRYESDAARRLPKAELIEGIVIMSPPVSDFHGMAIHGLLDQLLGEYGAGDAWHLAVRVNLFVRLGREK